MVARRRHSREQRPGRGRQLAKRLLVWPATIATVEKGQRRMDLLELCDYIKACDASPEKVLVAVLKACRRIKE